MTFVPLIRYCGGKRKQSEDIVNAMPQKMGTFWIPFLGSGAVMYQLLNSTVKFDRIVASDIYEPLMGIWHLVQDNPKMLIDSYTEHYNTFITDGEKYYQGVVDVFNTGVEHGSVVESTIFHFLTRSCMRGSLDYDRYGNFVSKCQTIKDGNTDGVISTPASIEPIVYKWHSAIRDVEFRCESYDTMKPEIQADDFCFLDPPYFDGTWYHDHDMDYENFYQFLRDIPCDYSVTLNGDREVYPIPVDLYDEHKYIYYGATTGKTGISGSRDSFYMRKRNLQYNPNVINTTSGGRPQGGMIQKNNEFTMNAEIINKLNAIDQKLDKVIGLLSK